MLAEDARLRQPFVQVGLTGTEWARLKDVLVAVHYLFERNCVVDRKNTHCALRKFCTTFYSFQPEDRNTAWFPAFQSYYQNPLKWFVTIEKG